MSTGETLEQRIIVTSSFKYQDYGSGGKTLCIMPSSATDCGELEPVSGIASGELRSTWAERAFAEIGVVSGRENFRRNCRYRRDYPRCELYGGYQESRHR